MSAEANKAYSCTNGKFCCIYIFQRAPHSLQKICRIPSTNRCIL